MLWWYIYAFLFSCTNNSIPVKTCAAYGVAELHAEEDMDTSTISYSYIDIEENPYEN